MQCHAPGFLSADPEKASLLLRSLSPVLCSVSAPAGRAGGTWSQMQPEPTQQPPCCSLTHTHMHSSCVQQDSQIPLGVLLQGGELLCPFVPWTPGFLSWAVPVTVIKPGWASLHGLRAWLLPMPGRAGLLLPGEALPAPASGASGAGGSASCVINNESPSAACAAGHLPASAGARVRGSREAREQLLPATSGQEQQLLQAPQAQAASLL